jgi:hypothetical protein
MWGQDRHNRHHRHGVPFLKGLQMTVGMPVVPRASDPERVAQEGSVTVMTNMTVVLTTWRVANSVYPSCDRGP